LHEQSTNINLGGDTNFSVSILLWRFRWFGIRLFTRHQLIIIKIEMMNSEQISQIFLEQYYGAMSSNRAGLINYYNDHSTMTYTGSKHRGLKEISEKI